MESLSGAMSSVDGHHCHCCWWGPGLDPEEGCAGVHDKLGN